MTNSEGQSQNIVTTSRVAIRIGSNNLSLPPLETSNLPQEFTPPPIHSPFPEPTGFTHSYSKISRLIDDASLVERWWIRTSSLEVTVAAGLTLAAVSWAYSSSTVSLTVAFLPLIMSRAAILLLDIAYLLFGIGWGSRINRPFATTTLLSRLLRLVDGLGCGLCGLLLLFLTSGHIDELPVVGIRPASVYGPSSFRTLLFPLWLATGVEICLLVASVVSIFSSGTESGVFSHDRALFLTSPNETPAQDPRRDVNFRPPWRVIVGSFLPRALIIVFNCISIPIALELDNDSSIGWTYVMIPFYLICLLIVMSSVVLGTSLLCEYLIMRRRRIPTSLVAMTRTFATHSPAPPSRQQTTSMDTTRISAPNNAILADEGIGRFESRTLRPEDGRDLTTTLERNVFPYLAPQRSLSMEYLPTPHRRGQSSGPEMTHRTAPHPSSPSQNIRSSRSAMWQADRGRPSALSWPFERCAFGVFVSGALMVVGVVGAAVVAIAHTVLLDVSARFNAAGRPIVGLVFLPSERKQLLLSFAVLALLLLCCAWLLLGHLWPAWRTAAARAAGRLTPSAAAFARYSRRPLEAIERDFVTAQALRASRALAPPPKVLVRIGPHYYRLPSQNELVEILKDMQARHPTAEIPQNTGEDTTAKHSTEGDCDSPIDTGREEAYPDPVDQLPLRNNSAEDRNMKQMRSHTNKGSSASSQRSTPSIGIPTPTLLALGKSKDDLFLPRTLSQISLGGRPSSHNHSNFFSNHTSSSTRNNSGSGCSQSESDTNSENSDLSINSGVTTSDPNDDTNSPSSTLQSDLSDTTGMDNRSRGNSATGCDINNNTTKCLPLDVDDSVKNTTANTDAIQRHPSPNSILLGKPPQAQSLTIRIPKSTSPDKVASGVNQASHSHQTSVRGVLARHPTWANPGDRFHRSGRAVSSNHFGLAISEFDEDSTSLESRFQHNYEVFLSSLNTDSIKNSGRVATHESSRTDNNIRNQTGGASHSSTTNSSNNTNHQADPIRLMGIVSSQHDELIITPSNNSSPLSTSSQETEHSGGSFSGSTCLICCDEPPEAVLMDCGHGGLCCVCASLLQAQSSTRMQRCPLCREFIFTHLRIAGTVYPMPESLTSSITSSSLNSEIFSHGTNVNDAVRNDNSNQTLQSASHGNIRSLQTRNNDNASRSRNSQSPDSNIQFNNSLIINTEDEENLKPGTGYVIVIPPIEKNSTTDTDDEIETT